MIHVSETHKGNVRNEWYKFENNRQWRVIWKICLHSQKSCLWIYLYLWQVALNLRSPLRVSCWSCHLIVKVHWSHSVEIYKGFPQKTSLLYLLKFPYTSTVLWQVFSGLHYVTPTLHFTQNNIFKLDTLTNGTVSHLFQ